MALFKTDTVEDKKAKLLKQLEELETPKEDEADKKLLWYLERNHRTGGMLLVINGITLAILCGIIVWLLLG